MKHRFGLDISDSSIKFVQLVLRGGKLAIGNLGEKLLPAGVIEGGEIKDSDQLGLILQELKNKFQLKDVDISLLDDEADFAGSYREVFSRAGLIIQGIETSGQALVRALVSPLETPSVILVDFGCSHTAIYFVDNGIVVATTIVPIGGEAITKSLAKNLKIDFAEAERLKIEVGLSRSSQNKEIFSAIIPIISVIKDEIGRAINLFFSQGKKPEQIILSGDQAALLGFPEYLEIHLKYPVVLGNPWLKIFPPGKVVSNLHFNEALRFSTAIGLVLRNFTRPQ